MKFIKLNEKRTGRTLIFQPQQLGTIIMNDGGGSTISHIESTQCNWTVRETPEQILAQIGGETMPNSDRTGRAVSTLKNIVDTIDGLISSHPMDGPVLAVLNAIKTTAGTRIRDLGESNP